MNISKVLPLNLTHFVLQVSLFLILVSLPKESLKAQLLGNPFIYNFLPEEYQAHNQSWEITELSNGHIAIATGNGIVLFDGEEFEMVRGTPLMITDLLTTSSGKTYYGMSNRFGQIVPDSMGYPSYHHLQDLMDEEHREFGAFHNMIEWEDDILVSTRDKLFRFDGEQFTSIVSIENNLFNIFKVNDKLYLGEVKTGLLTITENFDLEVAPGGEALTDDMIPYFMLPYNENQALIGTVRRGLYLYQTHETEDSPEGTLTPFVNEINDDLIGGSATYGITLSNGHYAIGTSTQGVFIMNRQGELVQRIYKENGLEVDVVTGLYEDQNGNLWIAMNYGFAIAEIQNPISFYDDRNGLEGTVLYAMEVDERLYVATSLGLFHLEGNKFVANPNVTALTWDLAQYENPDSPGDLSVLAANNHGIYLVNDMETTRLSEIYGASVMQSKVNPQRIYVGTLNGIFFIEKQGDQFISSDEIIRTESPARQLLEDKSGGIWVATQAHGVRYVHPDFDPDQVQVYTDDENYFVNHNPTMQMIEDTLYVSTITNFYRFDSVRDTFEEWRIPDLPEEEILGIYRFYHKDGTVWAGSSSERPYVTEFRNFFSDDAEVSGAQFRTIPQTVSLVINEIFNDIWFGNANGLYRYSLDVDSNIAELPQPQIRKIDLITDTIRTFLPIIGNQLEQPYGNTRFRFTVAAPWFDTSRNVEYRYRLEGYDQQWSDWTTNHVVEYTALLENEYQFQVQARNRAGVESSVAALTFDINPPWVRTIWAYLIYFILFGFFIYGTIHYSNRYKTRKLEAFNKKLEQEVQKRSEEIRQQNKILREMNREKNNFMNIAVHDLRNPLTGIQAIGELLSLKDSKLTQEEIQEIGKTINQSSNRMFELIENYLNVHRIEQREITAKPEPVSAHELIQRTIKRFSKKLAHKKMSIKPPESNVDVVLYSDPLLTSQIIENLLSNAIKYSPFGSEITIGIQAVDSRGEIYVRDEGPGIPKDKQDQLFKKFSKIGSKPTGDEVSIGLGLSIVKQLAEMMNGEVRCESESGIGSTFYVNLPQAKAAETY
tara:strand:+ start:13622 stop:16780 length:3159 start_codon:yes stop_codon:yes gene_type:complete